MSRGVPSAAVAERGGTRLTLHLRLERHVRQVLRLRSRHARARELMPRGNAATHDTTQAGRAFISRSSSAVYSRAVVELRRPWPRARERQRRARRRREPEQRHQAGAERTAPGARRPLCALSPWRSRTRRGCAARPCCAAPAARGRVGTVKATRAAAAARGTRLERILLAVVVLGAQRVVLVLLEQAIARALAPARARQAAPSAEAALLGGARLRPLFVRLALHRVAQAGGVHGAAHGRQTARPAQADGVQWRRRAARAGVA